MSMEKKTILFLHGFASSDQSAKARFFKGKFGALPQVAYHAIDFNPTAKDLEYMTTTGLIDRLRQYVLDHHLGKFSIIGSSYGGLIAVHYAHRFGGVDKMLLLAPGLRWLSGGLDKDALAHWEQATTLPVHHPAFEREIPVRFDMQLDGLRFLDPVPPATPVLIIHGRQDTTVPVEDSGAYAAEFADRVQLIQVDADHDLNGLLPFIWDRAQSFLLDV